MGYVNLWIPGNELLKQLSKVNVIFGFFAINFVHMNINSVTEWSPA